MITGGESASDGYDIMANNQSLYMQNMNDIFTSGTSLLSSIGCTLLFSMHCGYFESLYTALCREQRATQTYRDSTLMTSYWQFVTDDHSSVY